MNGMELVLRKIGEKLSLRPIIIATAIVYFKRFYDQIGFTGPDDPDLIAATCILLATKAEEWQIGCKMILSAVRQFLPNFSYNPKNIADAELVLLSKLNYRLLIYHPYRELTMYCLDARLEESVFSIAWTILN